MVSHKDHFEDKDAAHEAARAALLPVSRGNALSAWDGFISAMRYILPVLALVAGAVTVGWPLLNETEVSFTLSNEDVLRGDDKVHMKSLRYRGTDAVNRLFTVTAESGLQSNPNAQKVRLSGIRASIQLQDAGLALVTARNGTYHKKNATLSLIGGVNLETGSGYSLEMSGADVQLRQRIAMGRGNVKGETPIGALTADNFKVDVDQSIGTFNGLVKLHIVPKRTKRKNVKK